MKVFRKIILSLIVIFMACQHSPVIKAANWDGTEVIHARFFVITTGKNTTMEVPFNRHWFDAPASEYNHDLAKLSLGLAVSAFRPGKVSEYGTGTDQNLSDFLMEAHFRDLRSDDYDKDPSMYTVSTVMGHQTIADSSGGTYELIAVGVCGQGYVDEWESNFSIGSGQIHEGFERSSGLIYDRIFGYIAANKLSGHLKIWISGFSRAAAISNLTAGMLSDSDVFDQDDVFAYTFATPRTVKDENAGRYKNIFNIVGKADPVPKVPYNAWGFSRYGRDLYTPVLETDSDFEAKRAKANEVYKTITGIDYWYNREANEMVRDIMAYLLDICPSSGLYSASLQYHLIHIWEHKDPVTILRALLVMSQDSILINERTIPQANALMNYLTLMIRDYWTQESVFRGWNESASMAANVAQAHTPELYVSWMFSVDSGEQLYSDGLDYSFIQIETSYPVKLYHGNTLIETIDPIAEYDELSYQKRVLVPEKDRHVPETNQYLTYQDDGIVATLPKDSNFRIEIENGGEDKKIRLYIYDYAIDASDKMNFHMASYQPEGDDCFKAESVAGSGWDFDSRSGLLVGESNQRFDYGQAELDVSDTPMLAREHFFDLGWREAVILALTVTFVILALVIFYIAYLIGLFRFKRGVKKGWISPEEKYRALPILCTTAIFVLFLDMRFYAELFPENQHLLFGFKLAIGLLSVLIAWIGYRRRKDRLSLMVLISMLVFTAADITTTYQLHIGTLIHIAAYILLSYTYAKEEMPEKKQFIILAVLFIFFILASLMINGQFGFERLLAYIYLLAILTMTIFSFPMPRKVFAGSLLLFAAGILVIINVAYGTTFISHMISLGVYYAGITTLASMGVRRYKPGPHAALAQA